jgi:uncharacterized protein YbaA (DUF1428 family)
MGNQIMVVVGRIPKRNHNASMQLTRRFKEIFMKHRGLRLEDFQLNNSKSYEVAGLTNIVNTLSAKQDEEVWVELQYYRDRSHQDEVIAKMEKDEVCERLYKQSVALLTPGTGFIMGEFGRLSV